jgi:DNA polymerase III alpha subunit
MPEWKAKIDDKIKENDLEPEVAEVLWKVAEDSANYSFNKSHSISYAYLAAITIYLKFNHPQEFYLSLLKYAKFEPNSHEEIAKISQELCHFDIELLQPDLNKSDIDFKIEGKDIRYGLNSIKGVSTKVLISLLEFREDSFSNKYEVFLAAKQAGLNIGTLSALVQAGLLDSFVKHTRPRLVLELQTFNILTDREKRNLVEIGESYDYDIITSIHDVKKQDMVGDDNKVIFKDSRFETFKKKYQPYKKIYEMNKVHNKYANWYFEEKLLGYSYSYNIREIFSYGEDFHSADSVKDLEPRASLKFVGSLTDIIKRTSRNGNKYARLTMQDETGVLEGLFLDSEREGRLTNYLDSGKKLPKKGDVVIVFGSKGDDIVFLEKIVPLKDKIYMKLSELK